MIPLSPPIRAFVGLACRKGCRGRLLRRARPNSTLLLYRKVHESNKRYLRLHRDEFKASKLANGRLSITHFLLIPSLLYACKSTSRPRQTWGSHITRSNSRFHVVATANL